MIIYNKLGDYLKKNNLKFIDLQRALNLSPSVVAKFQKNRSVTTDTLNKICEFLEVQPGDIMEWIPDNPEKAKLEAQIAELQAKLKQI